MHLCIRHGARFKPTVEHVGHAPHHTFAGGVGRVRIDHVINIGLVQIGYLHAGFFSDFRKRAEHVDMRILRIVRFPDGNRRAPETVARDRPVAGAFQPFAETAVFNMFRHPVDFLIEANHLVAELGHPDKPGAHRLVNQRRVGAPAERIRVRILLFFDQQTVLFQPLHNRLVGFKHLLSFVVRNFGGKLAGLVHRADDRKIFVIGAAGVKVVLTETRRDMHHAGAVFNGNKLARQHFERAFFLQPRKIGEHRLIA